MDQGEIYGISVVVKKAVPQNESSVETHFKDPV
jgi:hypothetical protein